jgi:hypothetical protein
MATAGPGPARTGSGASGGAPAAGRCWSGMKAWSWDQPDSFETHDMVRLPGGADLDGVGIAAQCVGDFDHAGHGQSVAADHLAQTLPGKRLELTPDLASQLDDLRDAA